MLVENKKEGISLFIYEFLWLELVIIQTAMNHYLFVPQLTGTEALNLK